MPLQVVDRDERDSARPRDRLGRREPDEQRADQPRPARDADPREIAELDARLVERGPQDRRDELEVTTRGDLRHDAAEVRVELGLRRDDRRQHLPVRRDDRGGGLVTGCLDAQNHLSLLSRSTAAMSSLTPRLRRSPPLRLGCRCRCRGRVGVAPHDHCIFSVVSVVTTSDATRDEAEALVEGDRREVRDAYLQRVATLGVVAGHLEQPGKHRRRDPVPPVLGVDRDVHHVPRIDVPRQHQIPDELLVGRHGSDREGALLRELAGEHRARPGRRVRGALDPLDRVQVAELEPAQREAHATHLVASGSRTYTGSTSSAGPNAVASEAWRAARGTCSTESAGGTSAPRATSRSR